MINRKNIVLTALVLSLTAGAGFAGNNDLLKMDVHRSNAADTVDVTFYTTGGATNSVVTRKSDNRYVVLLPNVAGSSSVAPNIGGVKDLITNIDVKNVDDGIGGYTKVTFTTSKPVKIQTAMKKTAPLTKAQEDYKNLIAQNKDTKPVQKALTPAQTTKPAVKTETKSAANNNAKPAVQKSVSQTKPVNNQATQTKTNSKPTATAKVQNVKTVQPQVKTQPIEAAKPKTVNKSSDNQSKIKIDEDKKSVTNTQSPNNSTQNEQIAVASQEKTTVQPEKSTNVSTSNTQEKNQNKNIPNWLIGLGSVLGLILLGSLLKPKSEKSAKTLDKSLQYTDEVYNKKQVLKDIAEDESLSWQEKYNLYTETNDTASEEKSGMSYITDTLGSKKAILPVIESNQSSYKINKVNKQSKDSVENKEQTITPVSTESLNKDKLSFRDLVKSINNTSTRKEEILKEQLRTKISQMEHSFAQTPSLELPSEFAKKEIYSEDEKITDNMSNIRLKSFAKPSLKSVHRMLLGAERRSAQDKDIKEGRFVKLKSSPLNISRRKSASSDINSQNYFNNYGEKEMKREQDYSQASLNEYLSLLDKEENTRKSYSVPSVKTEVVNGTTSNPIKFSHHPSFSTINGMVVKSGYSIDSERGFYLVDMNGASAIVGKIKDNITVIKKFDGIINQVLQVRHDSDAVYMVKAGKYKCLVDISQDKMGTLIEI